MRYRALSPTGDYVFGRGPGEFLANTPETVLQSIQTRLGLWTGEWFLDQEEGTPYREKVIGKYTGSVYDDAIKERILGTTGVRQILDYASIVQDRALYVAAKIETIYGVTQLQQALPYGN